MQTFDARYKIQDQVDDATFHKTTFQSSIKLFEPWKVQLKPLKNLWIFLKYDFSLRVAQNEVQLYDCIINQFDFDFWSLITDIIISLAYIIFNH